MDFKFKINQRVFIKENDKIHFKFCAYVVGTLNMMGERFYLLDFEYSEAILKNSILNTIAYPESFLLTTEEAKEKYFDLKNQDKLDYDDVFNINTKPKNIKFL